MKRSLLLLMLCWLTLPAPARAQFDDDGKEGKKAHAKGDAKDPYGVQAERKAWDAWLKALGPGPVYRVEVLYRDSGDDRLYYLRALVSAKKPGGPGMFGLGVDERGRPIPPPNPGYVRLKQAEVTVKSTVDQLPPPPLAEKTRLLGVSLDPRNAEPGQLMIRASDVATNMPLPKKPGEIEVGCRRGLFLVELLTPEQLARELPLRQDPAFFHRRTDELRKLLLTTALPKLLADGLGLAHGMRTLREPKLLDELRRRLNAWIDLTAKEVKARALPFDLTSALGDCGDARDFELLHRLVKAHPTHSYAVVRPTLHLAQRVGGAQAVPVWTVLMNDPRTWEGEERVAWVRKLVPSIPEPRYGDHALTQLVKMFGLKPGDFHLAVAEAELIARAGQAKLTREQVDGYREFLKLPTWGSYLFLTEGDRQRGRETVVRWLAAYRPGK